MRYILLAATTSLLVSIGAASPARAQGDLARCAAIDDDRARLACFDEATGRAGRGDPRVATSPAPVTAEMPAAVTPATAAAGAVTTAPSTAAPAPVPAQKDGTDNFGLSAEQMKDTPERITAVVSSVASQAHIGRWVVTLDNGQVWEQRETTAPAKRPRPGDPVTIEKSSFGSYMMVAPGRGANRVKRVR